MDQLLIILIVIGFTVVKSVLESKAREESNKNFDSDLGLSAEELIAENNRILEAAQTVQHRPKPVNQPKRPSNPKQKRPPPRNETKMPSQIRAHEANLGEGCPVAKVVAQMKNETPQVSLSQGLQFSFSQDEILKSIVLSEVLQRYDIGRIYSRIPGVNQEYGVCNNDD